MRRTALLLLLTVTPALAQKDPVLYEHQPNLTPYRQLCLAAETIYPHEMKATDVQWIRNTIQSAIRGANLPILPENHPECAPMRLKASDTHLVLFVELAPPLKVNTTWPLQLRVVDPHLLGANGTVYRPILWELRQDIGPSRPKIQSDLRAALGWLSRAWKTSRVQ